MTTIGKNTPVGAELQEFVDKIENINAQLAGLADDKAEVMAGAKARGFSKRRIGEVIKIRKMKPQDRQEAEAELDIYLHALGMASEPPLLRYMARAGTDTAVRDTVLEAMKGFVPPHGLGDITVTMAGKPVRLARNKSGEVELLEVEDKPLPMKGGAGKKKPKAEVPDVSADQAEAMGRQFAQDNRPVIDNPFPYGDPRRARFDKGWRDGAGNDGMGPGEED
jgi:uncharacterized protein (UPF0335 family)